MRMQDTKLRWLALLAGATLAFAATAGAEASEQGGADERGAFYTWETEDGTLAFADDWKRVPKKYRATAEKRASRSLADYPRYTPQPSAAAAEYAARLTARLAHLAEVNAPAEATAVATADAGGRILLRTGSAAVPAIEVPSSGEGPVVVETKRYKPKGRIVTRHNTIVRQGDEIVAVVKQRQRGETNVSRDIRDEEDLLK